MCKRALETLRFGLSPAAEVLEISHPRGTVLVSPGRFVEAKDRLSQIISGRRQWNPNPTTREHWPKDETPQDLARVLLAYCALDLAESEKVLTDLVEDLGIGDPRYPPYGMLRDWLRGLARPTGGVGRGRPKRSIQAQNPQPIIP
jgi:hypothetical protein